MRMNTIKRAQTNETGMRSAVPSMRRTALVIGLALSQALLWHSADSRADRNDLPVFGYLEKVLIEPQAFPMQAKLDTGADNSSLNANIIERFERDGKPWIAFVVESIDGRELRLEKPVIRTARIKSHLGKAQSRPVVEIGFCIGGISRSVPVSLVDRTKFKYNLLIGRSFAAGHMLIDPSKKFTTAPNCAKDHPK